MGDFRIVIEASGGHGCSREVKDGGKVYGCQLMNCPDCQARAFVEQLQAKGVNVYRATLVHWPADCQGAHGPVAYPKENEVRDNLLTKVRSGAFAVLAFLALAGALLLGSPASAAPMPTAPDLLEHAALGQTPTAAPAPAVMPSADDPIALAGAIIDAVKAKSWLLAVSPAIVLLVLLLRRYGAKRFPWLDTKRGGYALSLAAALGVAIWAAATTPGAIGVLQVLVAAAIIWLTNDKVYEALKGLIWPDGAAKAEIVALDAGVAGAKTAAGAAKSPEAAADALNLVAGGKG